MTNKIILISAAIITVALSALFAGAETGIYQLSRLRLRLGIEKKRLSFTILGKAMRDSNGLLLSILIGNNITHYIVTSIVTYMLLNEVKAAHAAELFATFITAPILFVFAELIPKNIFFYRADSLMPSFAPVLFAFHRLFTWSGVVPLLKIISRISAQLTGAAVSAKRAISDVREHHIKSILEETREEAFLSSVQTDIISRVVTIPNIRIRSVKTPIKRVAMVELNCDDSTLLAKLKRCAFTRLLVYDSRPANIVGFINIYEALTSPKQFTDLGDFIQPIRRLSADNVVIDAINIMQREKQKMVLVVRTSHIGRERPLGIVTMKDLVEELLGELTEW